MIRFTVNEKKYEVNINEDTPLLWVLREHLNLTNTKFGCGVGQCGACTVLMNDESIRACSTPIRLVNNKSITTIANKDDVTIKKLQKFWIQEDVSQCGYCQPGQIMNASALLKNNPNPNDAQIIDSMNGNICRCGTYNKIKVAIKLASKEV